jgi:hypothetical protein
MTLREKQTQFWVMVAQLILKADDLGTPIFILEWTRSQAQQAANVAKGASKTMKSKHLEGLAVDICFLQDALDDGQINFSPDDYRELGEFWEGQGGIWGGRFGDDPNTNRIEGWDSGHFQFGE